jgi:mycoredoxin
MNDEEFLIIVLYLSSRQIPNKKLLAIITTNYLDHMSRRFPWGGSKLMKIVIYGTDWCPDCIRARRFLRDRQIAFEWINIDRDRQAEATVLKINQGMRSVPTIVFEDGSYLVEPPLHVLEQKFSG